MPQGKPAHGGCAAVRSGSRSGPPPGIRRWMRIRCLTRRRKPRRTGWRSRAVARRAAWSRGLRLAGCAGRHRAEVERAGV